MAEGIVIFAGKGVGLELLTVVLDRRDPVVRVIASSADDTAILDMAKARHVGAEVFDATTARRLAAQGRRCAWLLNFWSPHILPPEVLDLAEHRLNVHPSLVPLARGNDNAAWTIRKNLPAGVSLIEMRRGIDAGEVWAQEHVEYPWPIRGRDLHTLLQRELVALFKRAWPDILAGKVAARPQPSGEGCSFKRSDTERDRVRDAQATMTADEFIRWALAHDFSPGTTAELHTGENRYAVCITLEPLAVDTRNRPTKSSLIPNPQSLTPNP